MEDRSVEDAIGVIRSRKSKDRQQNAKRKDKQRFTKHTHETKDQVTYLSTRNPLKVRC